MQTLIIHSLTYAQILAVALNPVNWKLNKWTSQPRKSILWSQVLYCRTFREEEKLLQHHSEYFFYFLSPLAPPWGFHLKRTGLRALFVYVEVTHRKDTERVIYSWWAFKRQRLMGYTGFCSRTADTFTRLFFMDFELGSKGLKLTLGSCLVTFSMNSLKCSLLVTKRDSSSQRVSFYLVKCYK